jgi:hypothetical protein
MEAVAARDDVFESTVVPAVMERPTKYVDLRGDPCHRSGVYLSIDRRMNFSKNSWTSVRAAWVPTLTPLQLQKVVRNKEAKATSYRQQCREVWLLIVARGLEPSTHVDLGSEVEGYQFRSGFDRVFFLHHANKYVAELRVRRRVP